MSKFETPNLTRRGLLRTTRLAGLAASAASAQTHQHSSADTPRATSSPRYLQPGEFAALEVLCELIIPPDELSGGATDVGAAEYVYRLAAGTRKIVRIFPGGLAKLSAKPIVLFGQSFLNATPE